MPASPTMTRATDVLKQLRLMWIGICVGTIGFTSWCAYTLTDNNSWEPNPDEFDGRFTFIMSNSTVNIVFRLWFMLGCMKSAADSTGGSKPPSEGAAHKSSNNDRKPKNAASATHVSIEMPSAQPENAEAVLLPPSPSSAIHTSDG